MNPISRADLRRAADHARAAKWDLKEGVEAAGDVLRDTTASSVTSSLTDAAAVTVRSWRQAGHAIASGIAAAADRAKQALYAGNAAAGADLRDGNAQAASILRQAKDSIYEDVRNTMGVLEDGHRADKADRHDTGAFIAREWHIAQHGVRRLAAFRQGKVDTEVAAAKDAGYLQADEDRAAGHGLLLQAADVSKGYLRAAGKRLKGELGIVGSAADMECYAVGRAADSLGWLTGRQLRDGASQAHYLLMGARLATVAAVSGTVTAAGQEVEGIAKAGFDEVSGVANAGDGAATALASGVRQAAQALSQGAKIAGQDDLQAAKAAASGAADSARLFADGADGAAHEAGKAAVAVGEAVLDA